MGELVVFVVVVALAGVPAHVLGQRSGVRSPWVAFVPLVGPTIILLWSIRLGAWTAILSFIPFVNFVFLIWLVFAVPRAHHRSGWWGLALLVPLLGMYAYAFTLTPKQYAMISRTA